MDETAGMGLVLHRVREDIEAQKQALSHGPLKDYAEYREYVGMIRGLRSIENIIVDIHKMMES